MPVPMIEEKLKRVLNPVTLYRALEALEAADIVQRVDLQHRHAHYEMSKTHHHHAVCTSCGTVENIHSDELEEMIQKVGKKVSRFTLSAHSLELFGSCNTCVTAA
ncbi:MAG: ferric uptake regulator, Fur family [Candidatus Adlerbacteria bacterium]|nr:ferric uptake regulator, Fur family [Candidatus Adlerbacteria bacterium]